MHGESIKPSGVTKRQKVEEAITFSEDTTLVQCPYTNVVVVILNIDNYNVHCILVDNGSVINILYFSVFS